MSVLPYATRMAAAVREYAAFLETSMEAEEQDAGFDAGEWSGPAHARIRDWKLDCIALHWKVEAEDVFDRAVLEQYYGEDPMGVYMGRNE